MTTQQFRDRVSKSGTRIFVALPFDPNEVWGVKDRHFVTGTINGRAIRGPLGMEEGHYVLSLGSAWRRDNGIDAGFQINVVLSAEGPQSGDMPDDISEALANDPDARAFFDSLATFYRNTYIKWIEGAKQPATRAARVRELLKLLHARKKQK